MAAGSATGSGLFKFLRPGRLQSTDIQAAAMWGVAAATGALWVIQGIVMSEVEKFGNINWHAYAIVKHLGDAICFYGRRMRGI
ncbi:hypothetical protein HHK36_018689 [Tetracentron sinense]|uniref:Uncharacterized protein n=1 Tax=Tetracentron sinense TaxID=13715 RepID=A0A835DBI1_TETSI|nr:hypothetical protein HHK36_018689 [Tetracentron sinense]